MDADLSCLNQVKDGLCALEIQLRLKDQFNLPAFHYTTTEHINDLAHSTILTGLVLPWSSPKLEIKITLPTLSDALGRLT